MRRVNYHTVHLGFQNYWKHSVVVKYISTYYGYTVKKRSEKDLFDDDYVIFFLIFFLIFFIKTYVDAIQICTYNICLYKEVDKKYTGCSKTMELLDCVL